jgi:hypothetical protein
MKSECGGCGLIFVGVGAFDRHRIGEYKGPIYELGENGFPTGKILGYRPNTRRCLAVADLRALGMVQDHRGWWGEELTEAKREQLERLKQKKVATE